MDRRENNVEKDDTRAKSPPVSKGNKPRLSEKLLAVQKLSNTQLVSAESQQGQGQPLSNDNRILLQKIGVLKTVHNINTGESSGYVPNEGNPVILHIRTSTATSKVLPQVASSSSNCYRIRGEKPMFVSLLPRTTASATSAPQMPTPKNATQRLSTHPQPNRSVSAGIVNRVTPHTKAISIQTLAPGPSAKPPYQRGSRSQQGSQVRYHPLLPNIQPRAEVVRNPGLAVARETQPQVVPVVKANHLNTSHAELGKVWPKPGNQPPLAGQIHTSPQPLSQSSGLATTVNCYSHRVLRFIQHIWLLAENPASSLFSWHISGLVLQIHSSSKYMQVCASPVFGNNLHEFYHQRLLKNGFWHITDAVDPASRLLHIDPKQHDSQILYYHPCFQRGRPDLLWRIREVAAGDEPQADGSEQVPSGQDLEAAATAFLNAFFMQSNNPPLVIPAHIGNSFSCCEAHPKEEMPGAVAQQQNDIRDTSSSKNITQFEGQSRSDKDDSLQQQRLSQHSLTETPSSSTTVGDQTIHASSSSSSLSENLSRIANSTLSQGQGFTRDSVLGSSSKTTETGSKSQPGNEVKTPDVDSHKKSLPPRKRWADYKATDHETSLTVPAGKRLMLTPPDYIFVPHYLTPGGLVPLSSCASLPPSSIQALVWQPQRLGPTPGVGLCDHCRNGHEKPDGKKKTPRAPSKKPKRKKPAKRKRVARKIV